jgi:hypothetical protein
MLKAADGASGPRSIHLQNARGDAILVGSILAPTNLIRGFMQTLRFLLDVNIPSLDEFCTAHPNLAAMARGEGLVFFLSIMDPECYVACAVVTDLLHIPALAGVAAQLEALAVKRGQPLSDREKQYIGVVVADLMEANEFERTDKSGRVGVMPFNRGKLYRRTKSREILTHTRAPGVQRR